MDLAVLAVRLWQQHLNLEVCGRCVLFARREGDFTFLLRNLDPVTSAFADQDLDAQMLDLGPVTVGGCLFSGQLRPCC